MSSLGVVHPAATVSAYTYDTLRFSTHRKRPITFFVVQREMRYMIHSYGIYAPMVLTHAFSNIKLYAFTCNKL